MLNTLVHMYALPFQDRCRGFPQQLNRREASLHYALTPKETRSGQSAKPMSIPRSWPSLSSPSPSPPSCNVTSLQLPSSEFNLNLVKYWCQSFRHSGTPPLFIHPWQKSEKYWLTCEINVCNIFYISDYLQCGWHDGSETLQHAESDKTVRGVTSENGDQLKRGFKKKAIYPVPGVSNRGKT